MGSGQSAPRSHVHGRSPRVSQVSESGNGVVQEPGVSQTDLMALEAVVKKYLFSLHNMVTGSGSKPSRLDITVINGVVTAAKVVPRKVLVPPEVSSAFKDVCEAIVRDGAVVPNLSVNDTENSDPDDWVGDSGRTFRLFLKAGPGRKGPKKPQPNLRSSQKKEATGIPLVNRGLSLKAVVSSPR